MPAICFHWRFFHHVCTVSVLSVASVIRFRVVSSVVLAFSISIYSEQEVFTPSTCVSWSWDGCCTCTCRRGRSGFVNKSVERVHVQCDALPSEKWQRQQHHLPFFLTSHLTMIKITYNKVTICEYQSVIWFHVVHVKVIMWPSKIIKNWFHLIGSLIYVIYLGLCWPMIDRKLFDSAAHQMLSLSWESSHLIREYSELKGVADLRFQSRS